MRAGDGLILFVLSIVAVIWLYTRFRRWALVERESRENKWTVEPDDEIIVTEAVELLEQAGYEVLTGKKKIPVTIRLDHTNKLATRLFVDHFAEGREGIYVVKVARESRPVPLDEESIRTELLPYQLLFSEAAGVLYVDSDRQTVHKLQFNIDSRYTGG